MPKVKRKRGRRNEVKPVYTTGNSSSRVEDESVHEERLQENSTTLFSRLHETLMSHASEHPECSEYAPSIEKYMRFKFPFFGIKSPPRRALLKKFVASFDSEFHDFDTLASLLHKLWEAKEREFQNCGVDLMEQFKDVLLSRGFDEAVGVVQHCIVTKSWWDTVDAISYPVIGYFVKKSPSLGRHLVQEWIDHENMWLRRVAILHQLFYKKETDEKLLFSFCLKRSHEEEFFIRKAIGWALRQYSRTNKKAVKDFVTKNTDSLSNLSVREALKHC